MRQDLRAQFLFLILASAFLPAGCGPGIKEGVYGRHPNRDEQVLEKGLKPREFFTAELNTSSKEFAKADQVRDESAKIDEDYRLGPGDRFAFLVRGREDISREEIIVAPDGRVDLPRVGIVDVKGRTLSELSADLTKALEAYYEKPEVTIVMKAYNNNRVFVLGRVANPGAVHFQGQGTLLEALSLAGGLPVDTTKSFLSRCMIVRGKNLVMWIDLRELLERGNMNLNARLKNGDVIFIPQSEDQLAFVLGEVRSPGVIPLRAELTVLDALMTVGGPTKSANTKDIFLIRQVGKKGVVEKINFRDLIAKADYSRNYVLKTGDMIYVPETGLSKLNYFTSQIAPAFTLVGVTANTITGLGLLNGLSAALYGNSLYGGSNNSNNGN